MIKAVPAASREHDDPSRRLQQIRAQLVRAMSGQDGTFEYLPEIVASTGSRGGIRLRLPIGGDGHLEVEEPYRNADLRDDNSNLQIENLVDAVDFAIKNEKRLSRSLAKARAVINRLVASRRAAALLELTGVNYRRLRKGPLGSNLRIVLSARHLSDRLRVEDHDYVFGDATTARLEMRDLIASLKLRACRLEEARSRAAGAFICPVLAHVLEATGSSPRHAIAAARRTGVLTSLAGPSVGIAWQDGILGCRFDLDRDIGWDCGKLTVPALPEQVVLTLRSRRLGELIRHHLLPPDLVVAKAETTEAHPAVYLKVLGYAIKGARVCKREPLTRRRKRGATRTT